MQFIVAKALGLAIDYLHGRAGPLLAQNSYDLYDRIHVGRRYLLNKRCDRHPEPDCGDYDGEYFACFGVAANRAIARRFNYTALHMSFHAWNHLYDPTDVAFMKIGVLFVYGEIEPIELTGVDISMIDIDESSLVDGDKNHIICCDSRPLKILIPHYSEMRVTSYGHVTLLLRVGNKADDETPVLEYDVSRIEAKSVTVWLVRSSGSRHDVILTGKIPGDCIRSNHQFVHVTLNGEKIKPVFDQSVRFFVAKIDQKCSEN